MGREKHPKKKKQSKGDKSEKKPLLSDRQKRVLLMVILAMIIMVPIVDVIRCKSTCMKKVKTPYPEIACRYECPWPWQKGK